VTVERVSVMSHDPAVAAAAAGGSHRGVTSTTGGGQRTIKEWEEWELPDTAPQAGVSAIRLWSRFSTPSLGELPAQKCDFK